MTAIQLWMALFNAVREVEAPLHRVVLTRNRKPESEESPGPAGRASTSRAGRSASQR
jgi:hypothetical protein